KALATRTRIESPWQQIDAKMLGLPMPSTHKKVVVRKFGRDSLQGYVAAEFIMDGKLELLNTAGNVVALDLKEIKSVYFVRDFGDTDPGRKTFAARERTTGL